MKKEDIIEYLQQMLRMADKAGEPDGWNISLPKQMARDVIAHFEDGDEHIHLAAAVLSLGG